MVKSTNVVSSRCQAKGTLCLRMIAARILLYEPTDLGYLDIFLRMYIVLVRSCVTSAIAMDKAYIIVPWNFYQVIWGLFPYQKTNNYILSHSTSKLPRTVT